MSQMTLGNMTIDRDRYEVSVAGRWVELTFVEFELLYELARNIGKVMSRARLMQAIWKEHVEDKDQKLTVHVSRLRNKLKDSDPWQIETVPKRGYALTNYARTGTGGHGTRAKRPHSVPPLGQVV
jgi:DNA-binding response OmpR family regulator